MNFDLKNIPPFGTRLDSLPFADSSFPNNIESQYLRAMHKILIKGNDTADRTGTWAREIFGIQMRQNLNDGFPLFTTKKVHTKSIVRELMWIKNGLTNIKYLKEHGVTIWDDWADANGDLGPVYGEQWRNWGGIDQLANVIQRIKTHPTCRRQIVSTWNVVDLPKMALMPCHVLFQFRVHHGRLSCQLYQRSADMFLGVPFNIPSYSLLTHMVADVCGLGVGELIWTGGSCHIYSNHFEQVKLQLSQPQRPFPSLELTHRDKIDDFVFEDVKIAGYNPGITIKAPVAV